MALNDIIVPKVNANGDFTETVLTAGDLKLGTTANLPLRTGSGGVIEAGSFGTAAGSFCAGDDARLSDARTPTAHKTSHATGGTDALSPADIGAATTSHTHAAADVTSGTLDVARLPVGTGSTQVAAGNHTHVVADVTGAAASGSITSSGLTQATARILGRTTASTGAVEEIQIGSGLSLSAGELSANFAAPPAIGNTTPAAGTFTTLTANNGTLTASAPVLDLAQTWNNAAVTFTGLRANFTNTASAAASRLMDLQLGGTSQFYVERSGTIVGNVSSTGTLLTSAVNFVAFDVGAPAGGRIRFAGNGLGVQPLIFWATSGSYRFGPDGNAASTTTGFYLDTEGTSNVLALRNGTNAQESRIYNTFTSSTNHERGFLKWSSNVFQIGTEKGSGGGTARALEFQTDGVTRMTLGSAGEIGFFGTAAAAQPAAIADAADAATTQARLNDLLAAMRTLGLIDT